MTAPDDVLGPVAAAGDLGPPGAAVRIELTSAGPGLFDARLADGTVVAVASARPFSDAAAALVAAGEHPGRRAVLVYAGTVLRIAMLGAAAGDGR
jgi:hypothetical protein